MPLPELRDVVARLADRGETLERIEAEVVEPAPLDEDRQAALWLYAWLRTSAHQN
jgi:hypothetical protein